MENVTVNFMSIPLNRLSVSPQNVRKTEADNIDDLLSSIPVHGLLQSLVIQPDSKKDYYQVVAGGRRLRALTVLAKERRLPMDFQVPCRLLDASQSVEEISLAENVIRLPMHPADQFESFAAQIEAGKSITDVANAFGVSETIVRKRMKLGCVAPEILAAYRAGELEFEQVAAYSISDDRNRQRDVFNTNPRAHSHAVKAALTTGEVTLSDRRARLVGLDAYGEAGGSVRHDLFAEGDRGVYLIDVPLLDRLAAAKTNRIIEDLKAEGWKEAFCYDGQFWQLQQEYKGRIHPQRAPFTEAEQVEHDRISARMEEIEVEAEDDDDFRAEFEKLSQALDGLVVHRYAPDDMAKAAAAIVFDHNGNYRIERGLLKSAPKSDGSKAGTADKRLDDSPAPSSKLQVELAAVRTAAVAADLANNTHVALVVTVHALASIYFSLHTRVSASLLSGQHGGCGSSIENTDIRPLAALSDRMTELRKHMPDSPADWWSYFLDMSDERLLQHLALFTAQSLKPFGQFIDPITRVHGDQIAAAVGTDVKQWVTLSDLGFFERSRKAAILAAVEDIKGKDRAENLSNMKKGPLVERATAELDGLWLPSQLDAFASEEDRERVSKMAGFYLYSGHSHNEVDDNETGGDDQAEYQ